jgi:putative FmdB family regulatory protein
LEVNVPIYEYRCQDCKRRVSIFWRTFSEAESGTPACPRCGGADLTRLVSRVFDESDPQSLGRWMRKMSAETGEDLGPEFDEVVGRLEAGENPEEIEKTMPELMGEGGGEDFSGGLDF